MVQRECLLGWRVSSVWGPDWNRRGPGHGPKKPADRVRGTPGAAPERDSAVLVVGFGPGVGLRLLAERVTRGRVCGIDPSTAMLRQARRRNRSDCDSGRIDVRRGRCDALPWASNTFDGVIAVNTIQLCDPLPRSVDEVARVLRPGARFVSYTHEWAIRRSAGNVNAWTARLAALCQQRGFTDVKSWRGHAESGTTVAFTARQLGADTSADDHHVAPPVACTLGPDDGQQRMLRWRQLADRATPTARRTGRVLEVRFQDKPGVQAELEALAAAEQQCCSFVAWTVTIEADQPVLHVTAPPDRAADIEPIAITFGAH